MKAIAIVLAAAAIAAWLLLVSYNIRVLISVSRFENIGIPASLPFIGVPLAGLIASIWLGFFSRRALPSWTIAIIALALLAGGLFLLTVVMASRAG
jgi:hypothetical protein